MYTELAEFYRRRIFSCTRCTQNLMNPYLHSNPKHDPPGSQLACNRRKYQLDYIASKEDIRIVIVGEAPGLDGCGYGGIAFTGEYNAVKDLGLPNYHETQGNLQKEQSANLVYGAMASYAKQVGCPVAQVAKQIYLTNAAMCVPLAKNGKSIAAPQKSTKVQCLRNLVEQLEIIRPQLVITLGANALGTVTQAYNQKIQGKLTDIVLKQRRGEKTFALKPGLDLAAELHPSPRNRVLGELYAHLPARLVNIFAAYLA